MPHNENSRVKIPALVHFTRLGYKYISLRKYEGVIDDDTNILVDVLCDAINRINATSLTTTDVQKIVNALKAMLENDDLGREFYSVLINGYNGLKLIVILFSAPHSNWPSAGAAAFLLLCEGNFGT